MNEIFKSSDKLMKIEQKKSKRDYPWDLLEVGQSFAISKEEITMQIARPMCSIQSKLKNKRFRAVEHETVIEIGRIEGEWSKDDAE